MNKFTITFLAVGMGLAGASLADSTAPGANASSVVKPGSHDVDVGYKSYAEACMSLKDGEKEGCMARGEVKAEAAEAAARK